MITGMRATLSRRCFSLSVLLCGFALASACACTPALADTTHLYLGSFNLPNNAEPVAVDAQNNLYVWQSSTSKVAKYNATTHAPVNFSALGSNTIDGAGGSSCPAVPADCDRVPVGGLDIVPSSGTYGQGAPFVGVDTSGGPANGYIYVANGLSNQIEVFDATGTYKGEIDTTHPGPRPCSLSGNVCPISAGMSISSDGHIFVGNPSTGGNVIDEYAPVDGDPAHDQFVGQIFHYSSLNGSAFGPGVFTSGCQFFVAGSQFTYCRAVEGYTFDPPAAGWWKFSAAEFRHVTSGPSDPVPYPLFSPGNELFGDGGKPVDQNYQPTDNGFLTGSINPANEHIFITNTNTFREFDPADHKVGPSFGYGHIQVNGGFPMAFNNAGGADDGDIYVAGPGSGNISVFGPPVPIPDIAINQPDLGHTTATIKADVSLAGGPSVTDCKIGYGSTAHHVVNQNELDTYDNYVPCDQATPFSGTTSVTAHLSSLTPEADVHYAVIATNSNGSSQTADHVLRPPAVLDLKTDPATDITKNTAALNGSLDADGLSTQYHFEYGTSTSYGQTTPSVDAGSGSGDASVDPVTITSLQSNQTYHYRIVATNNLGTTVGPDRSFTAASPPRIAGVRTTNLTETSVDLSARINPVGFDTTYHFEYGPTKSLDSSIPATDADVGAGNDDQTVTAHLSGLQSGIVYYYKLVATNKWGTTESDVTTFNFFPPVDCPNSHIRQVTRSSYLPDCRAYELVSPGDAGEVTPFPGDVTEGLGTGFVWGDRLTISPPNYSGLAENPPRFGFYGAYGQLAGTNPPNSVADLYVATRTSTGWVTTYPGSKGNAVINAGDPHCDVTLSKCYDHRTSGLGFNPFLVGSDSPNLWNVDGASLGRLPTNTNVVPGGDQTTAPQDMEYNNGVQYASPDFSHFVFSQNKIAFASGGLTHAPGSVYDNDLSEETVQIVSLLPSGDPIPQDTAANPDPTEYIDLPKVSMNGSHILMSTATGTRCYDFWLGPGHCPPPAPVHLYMRVNDAVSYDIAQGQAVFFDGMTSDGSKVFFTADAQMTPDDTDNSSDIYMWSEATDSLTLVSQGNGNGNSDSCTASWTSGCGAEAIYPYRQKYAAPGDNSSVPRGDGQYIRTQYQPDNVVSGSSGDVYFYSPEQLDPVNPGVLNARNLYDFHDGHVQLVAVMDDGATVDRMQISPDGQHAAFLTRARLTGYDNAGFEEMYSYDASTETLKCVSCKPDGTLPTGDVAASQSGLFMSNDGRTFFATPDPLVPQDTDDIIDVYEYVDGRPQLISSGTGARDSLTSNTLFPPLKVGLEGVSADGLDVYFSTFDTLVPEDHNSDALSKFYDARTNGGFPPAPAPPPCVAADECHGVGSSAPASPQIGSGADLGAGGNLRSQRRVKRGNRSKRHKRHHHRVHRSSQRHANHRAGSRGRA